MPRPRSFGSIARRGCSPTGPPLAALWACEWLLLSCLSVDPRCVCAPPQVVTRNVDKQPPASRLPSVNDGRARAEANGPRGVVVRGLGPLKVSGLPAEDARPGEIGEAPGRDADATESRTRSGLHS